MQSHWRPKWSLSLLPWGFERPVRHRFDFVEPLADWVVITHPLFQYRSNGTDVDGLADLFGGHLVGEFDIDVDAGMRSAAVDAEDLLAALVIPDELHTTPAKNAAVALEPDRVRRVVGSSLRELIRETGHRHIDLVADRLQRAPAGLLTAGAVVVALGEQHLHQSFSRVAGLWVVDLHPHPVAHLDRTGDGDLAVDLDRTNPAGAQDGMFG